MHQVPFVGKSIRDDEEVVNSLNFYLIQEVPRKYSQLRKGCRYIVSKGSQPTHQACLKHPDGTSRDEVCPFWDK